MTEAVRDAGSEESPRRERTAGDRGLRAPGGPSLPGGEGRHPPASGELPGGDGGGGERRNPHVEGLPHRPPRVQAREARPLRIPRLQHGGGEAPGLRGRGSAEPSAGARRVPRRYSASEEPGEAAVGRRRHPGGLAHPDEEAPPRGHAGPRRRARGGGPRNCDARASASTRPGRSTSTRVRPEPSNPTMVVRPDPETPVSMDGVPPPTRATLTDVEETDETCGPGVE